MSLLSAIILPKLEKELMALEPQVAQFILSQLKSIGQDLIEYLEGKLNLPKDQAPDDVAE